MPIQSAKLIVLDAKGKALLLRRSRTHRTQALRPDIPGGTTERGETVEDGLLREAAEEIGLKLTLDQIHLIYTKTYDTIPGLLINRFLYATRLQESAPDFTLSWEHDKYEWVDIDALMDLEEPYQEGVDFANKHKLWDTIR